MSKRTHVVLSERSVKNRTKAAERELMRLRQLKALKAAAGSWKDKDHPELKSGAAKWVAKLRSQDEKRFQKATAR
ncbi:MAG TPA: hypothetical protein VIX89_17345 [Bryobacteraceae bacterium]